MGSDLGYAAKTRNERELWGESGKGGELRLVPGRIYSIESLGCLGSTN